MKTCFQSLMYRACKFDVKDRQGTRGIPLLKGSRQGAKGEPREFPAHQLDRN